MPSNGSFFLLVFLPKFLSGSKFGAKCKNYKCLKNYLFYTFVFLSVYQIWARIEHMRKKQPQNDAKKNPNEPFFLFYDEDVAKFYNNSKL